MKNIKRFDDFENVHEGALGTAAASLGMRGKGSSTTRNTSKGDGDKNDWKKYVNPKHWFKDDEEKEDWVFKGMGETEGFFSGKKWVWIYENSITGKIKVSDKKIDKYHTEDDDSEEIK